MNVHNKLISSAAKAELEPIGCYQQGRSRIWLSDQRFWVAVIEFQPGKFSKGSYLNVGACWLWCAKEYWSFDFGYRIEPFVEFKDSPQFATAARKLATRAAEEVGVLRKRLSTLPDIARELRSGAGSGGWPAYHAAVASGLAGEVSLAGELFERLIAEPVKTEWQREQHKTATKLVTALHDIGSFRSSVRSIIKEARALHKLPPDPSSLGDK